MKKSGSCGMKSVVEAQLQTNTDLNGSNRNIVILSIQDFLDAEFDFKLGKHTFNTYDKRNF